MLQGRRTDRHAAFSRRRSALCALRIRPGYPAHFELAGRPAHLFVCNGTCSRENRPLACRLFPLFLHFKKDGSPRVKLDVRAKAVCPLCDYGVIGLRTEFVAAAKTAYAALMEDDECAAFLRALDEAFSL